MIENLDITSSQFQITAEVSAEKASETLENKFSKRHKEIQKEKR